MTSTLAYPEIRGMILKVIYTNLPEPVGDKLMADILQDAGYLINAPLVQGHFRYLADEEKAYIRVQEANIEDMGISRLLATITSKGVDFVEGRLPADPGVKRIE